MPAILYYKKNSKISHSDISESSSEFWRIRTAVHTVCRPLTKPLIKEPIFLVCGCKGSTFLELPTIRNNFFFISFFLLSSLHSERFFSYNRFNSQPVAQFSQGLRFPSLYEKKKINTLPYTDNAQQQDESYRPILPIIHPNNPPI